MAGFMSLASGLDWETARAVIDDYVPSSVAQAIRDADTFCGVDLPALSAWEFGPEDAAAVSQPVLSVLGAETEQLFVDGASLLRSWLPELENLTVEGVGHLLQIQRPEPVARGIAGFFGRHPIAAVRRLLRWSGRPMRPTDAEVAQQPGGVGRLVRVAHWRSGLRAAHLAAPVKLDQAVAIRQGFLGEEGQEPVSERTRRDQQHRFSRSDHLVLQLDCVEPGAIHEPRAPRGFSATTGHDDSS
jgi:hypothetical protein